MERIVSIQLISLASRESPALDSRYGLVKRVSIQLISLASREEKTKTVYYLLDEFPFN